MKVACDICEKVEDEYRASKWLQINTRHFKYLLCDKCEDKFWNIFKKDEQKVEREVLDNPSPCKDCEIRNKELFCDGCEDYYKWKGIHI